MIVAIDRGLRALSRALDRLCTVIAFVALHVMLLSVLLQIVARYVFHAPPAWTEELARYAMIWSAMAGAAMAYYRGADPVMMKFDTRGLPGRTLFMQSIEAVAVLTLAAPVFYYAPGFLERHSHRITETLEWNSAAVVVIIPASFVIIVVHLAARWARALRDFVQQGAPR
ncbi:MAG: hypothetical protein NAOJABEB_00630 [Steroidobacteraceae bacterium]|nr:hypothetical protein [Steroidobacteraceae bacterium]